MKLQLSGGPLDGVTIQGRRAEPDVDMVEVSRRRQVYTYTRRGDGALDHTPVMPVATAFDAWWERRASGRGTRPWTRSPDDRHRAASSTRASAPRTTAAVPPGREAGVARVPGPTSGQVRGTSRASRRFVRGDDPLATGAVILDRHRRVPHGRRDESPLRLWPIPVLSSSGFRVVASAPGFLGSARSADAAPPRGDRSALLDADR